MSLRTILITIIIITATIIAPDDNQLDLQALDGPSFAGFFEMGFLCFLSSSSSDVKFESISDEDDSNSVEDMDGRLELRPPPPPFGPRVWIKVLYVVEGNCGN